ncbi:MAG: Omp28 family outer membrane lipoprotein [Prevotellaceae bacterium]|jgi:hypothetical protein|nr:Omp28 family outer membrane lipoprotein [Prevotellaceae bacterium]
MNKILKNIKFGKFSFRNYSANSIILLILFFTACDEIAENERIVPADKINSQNTVLLEDYTGYTCTNCPAAAAMAATIKQTLDKSLTVVSIHTGPFSINSPFNTEAGDEYRKRFYPNDADGYPAGSISRMLIDGKFVNTQFVKWGTSIVNRLNSSIPNIQLSLSANYSEADKTFSVKSEIKATDAPPHTLKLQLWITESGIKYYQTNGTPSPQEYIHNHVLRDAINGVWGEDISIAKGETKEMTSRIYDLNAKEWKPANSGKPENMHIVGFIYDSETMEVIDVKEIELIEN